MVIPMANGAFVVAAKLQIDVRLDNKDTVRPHGQPYGVVLAHFGGQWVTWSVWLPLVLGATEYQAVSGHYFSDYLEALDDFDNRAR